MHHIEVFLVLRGYIFEQIIQLKRHIRRPRPRRRKLLVCDIEANDLCIWHLLADVDRPYACACGYVRYPWCRDVFDSV